MPTRAASCASSRSGRGRRSRRWTTATAERPHERAAQRALARDLTVLVHGEDAWARATRTSEALFGRGRLDEADPAELEVALGDAPTVELDGAAELPSYAELFQRAGLVSSISEAVRLAAGGGLSVNDDKVDDVRQSPASDDFLGGRLLVLARGRRNRALVRRGGRLTVPVCTRGQPW